MTVIPFGGTAAVGPARGWHGMKARPQRRYRPEDWKTWGEIGDDARIIESVRGSPAWLGDLCPGVWILSINGMSFDAFERSSAAPGDIVEVRAFGPGLGTFSRKLVLLEPPPQTPAPAETGITRLDTRAAGIAREARFQGFPGALFGICG